MPRTSASGRSIAACMAGGWRRVTSPKNTPPHGVHEALPTVASVPQRTEIFRPSQPRSHGVANARFPSSRRSNGASATNARIRKIQRFRRGGRAAPSGITSSSVPEPSAA